MTAVKHNFLFKGYFNRKAKDAADKKAADIKATEKAAEKAKAEKEAK